MICTPALFASSRAFIRRSYEFWHLLQDAPVPWGAESEYSLWADAYIVTLLAQQVQGISIHHHRSLAYLYLLQQSRLGLCRLSQSRTYRHGW
mgnify:CR=1 FL=1